MKKLFYAIALVFPAIMFAQNDLVIEERDAMMSYGSKPSYSVVIPQSQLKDVMDDFKKYIKKDSKGKVTDNLTEISIVGAVNTNISALPFNVFGKLTETTEGVLTMLWISEGEVFISSATAPTKSEAVKKYLRDFAVQEYRNAVQRELKAEQDKAKAAQKTLDGFVQEQKKAEGNVTDYKAQIASLEKKIQEREQSIANAVANKAKQQTAVEAQVAAVAKVQEKLSNIK